jgi:hypothetical protein
MVISVEIHIHWNIFLECLKLGPTIYYNFTSSKRGIPIRGSVANKLHSTRQHKHTLLHRLITNPVLEYILKTNVLKGSGGRGVAVCW